jgi:hypothetical protein
LTGLGSVAMKSGGYRRKSDGRGACAAEGRKQLAIVLYVIALVLTVLLMKVADLIHGSAGDVRIAVFLFILFLVNYILGRVPFASSRRAA